MRLLALFALMISTTAWAIIPANPHAAHQAAAIQGDQQTHDALVMQQRKKVREYQKRLHENMQRLVEAKTKLWQLEHGQNQSVLPLAPGPVMPQNTHSASPTH